MKRKEPSYTQKTSAEGYGGAKKRRIVKGVSHLPMVRYQGTRFGYDTVPRTMGFYSKGEMKYFDTALALSSIAASTDWTGTEQDPATILNFCSPGPGTGSNQRVGRDITLMKLKIKGYVYLTAGTFLTYIPSNLVRIILYEDNQTNSTQAQGEDVIDGTGGVSVLHAFQNINNFGRFRVWKDKFLEMNITNTGEDGTTTAGLFKSFKFNLRFPQGKKIHFNATGGNTIADVSTTSFHLLANSNHVGNGVCGIAYKARACYKDV